jgi:hypothetical protein
MQFIGLERISQSLCLLNRQQTKSSDLAFLQINNTPKHPLTSSLRGVSQK